MGIDTWVQESFFDYSSLPQIAEKQQAALKHSTESTVISAGPHPVIDGHVYRETPQENVTGTIVLSNVPVHKNGRKVFQYSCSITWMKPGYFAYRENGPAVENADGSYERWENGRCVMKRPVPWYAAIDELWYTVNSNGDKEFFNGETRHRENGPAIEWADGRETYIVNGKFHRLDGPAVVEPKLRAWYEYGVLIRSEETYPANVKGQEDVELSTWYKDALIHRENGPAQIKNGSQYWYHDGLVSRTNGPAIVKRNGDQEWFLDGRLHRVGGGPAITVIDGVTKWYFQGKLHRIGAPAIVYPNGQEAWYWNGNLHRDNGPAITLANGVEEYWINDQRHRLDGPAVEVPDEKLGPDLFFVNGKELSRKDFYKKYGKEPKKKILRKKDAAIEESQPAPESRQLTSEEALYRFESLVSEVGALGSQNLPDGHLLKL